MQTMEQIDVVDEVIRIVELILKIPAGVLEINSEFKNLDFNSANKVKLRECIERKFNISISQEQLLNHNTVDSLVKMISRHLANSVQLSLEDQAQRIVTEFNQTQTNYPKNQCIHHLFAAQVKRTPDKVAVVFGQQQLTYQQLYERSSTLALYLQQQGVRPDSLVGLCVERSLDMLVGIFGILQAGAAYVPLDPDYPDDRLAYMIQDSQADIVLTQEKLQCKLSAFVKQNTRLINLDQQWLEITRRVSELKKNQVELQHLVRPNHLAYVIYTSGSTGQPKGVMIEHQSLVNHNCYAAEKYQINEADKQIQFSGISFDLFVEEVFVVLNRGAQLILAHKDQLLTLDYFKALIEEHRVTVLNLPTAFFHQLVVENVDLSGVKTIIIGGEKLDYSKACEFVQRYPEIRLHNTYGPTETTIISSAITVTQKLIESLNEDKPVESSQNIPIGKPIANTQIYILDQNNNPQPVGVPGELHIAGDGLARGYLNRPDLTNEKFVVDPFKSALSSSELTGQQARMYKSGDLARWLENGTIEYLGRIDTQVKIRGFRVEMGEIEAELNQHPLVKDSVVVAQKDPVGQRLIGFYVSENSEDGNNTDSSSTQNEELRDYLKQALPEYMLPSALVNLKKIPLTPNGKVDRRALENTKVAIRTSHIHIAPRNDIERQLVEFWSNILNIQPEKIGVNDSFFELGGHSLLATQLISRIRQHFSVDISQANLFEQRCISNLAVLIDNKEQSKVPAIKPVNRSALTLLPLSFAQGRLWFIDQLEPGNVNYNIPTALVIKGKLDVKYLSQAFDKVIARHDNLRTVFPSKSGQAHQLILDCRDFNKKFKLELSDLCGENDLADRESLARQICQAEANKPFDLATGPLIRARVIKVNQQKHILMINMHHIIGDDWSLGILLKELFSALKGIAHNQPVELPPLPIQYLDYSVWQRKWLEQAGVLEQQLTYWNTKLSGVPECLNLATDYPRPTEQNFAGSSQTFVLDSQVSKQLKQLAEKQNATLYMTLLAVFKVLLFRYTGQQDICVGSPIANRQFGETEDLIGMFVNTLALRSELDGEDTFAAFLSTVKTTCLEAYENQDTPFEKIVERVQPNRNMAISPLFQVMLVLQNAISYEENNRTEPFPLTKNTSLFDISFEFTESANGINGSVEYSTALYKPQTIERMIKHFIALCRAVTVQPNLKINELSFVEELEKHQLLTENNRTLTDYPKNQCIHHLFAAQVKRTPDKVAAVFGEEQITYQQLFDRSSTLALYLQQQGVRPDSLVGLCVERSLDMLVGIFGILQAGAAYVPLDPDYPDDRLAYMIQDSRADIVLTQEKLQRKLNAFVKQNTHLINLDQQWPEITHRVSELKKSQVELQHLVRPNHLAYVIYTSGSTGQPKGVMIEHQSLVNHNCYAAEKYQINEADKQIQFSSISFDLFVEEVFVVLNRGAQLILAHKDELLTLDYFKALIEEHRVTVLNLPTAFFHQLVVEDVDLGGVKTIIIGGEKLDYSKACEFVRRYPQICLHNTYGPTETTIISSAITVTQKLIESLNEDKTVESSQNIPIGKPIANTQIYILDQNNNPQPVGVPGELHIAGDGLARGYLNRPDLTNEKFVVDPFKSALSASELTGQQARMYKSGDLARWLENGTIEYLGRIDTQVKIRGFRVEMGEIETELNQHPSVKDSVVVAQKDSIGQRLIGFYVPENSEDGNSADNFNSLNGKLREYLKQALPEYMLPAALVNLKEIPLTPNGKVDRRALELWEVNIESSQSYLASRNQTEKELVSIWSKLLNREAEKIGVNDNFFELGGHSLLATQLVSKIRSQLKIDLPLKAVFSAHTVAGIAEAINAIQYQHKETLDTDNQFNTEFEEGSL
ncbi:non-ribosomal peptide synthetase [Aliikangiella coralliicola]|uniref:Amino acid adenylation domain-containing protein n=1 Tax=Aliikangiella coralliicola TaxID=2592383 RepID=A0A545U978_9GAMM|nr:non-ribosomal peptide synthetase [Aliikangiella coralliicola]TQV85989.1 amino acid adenylation domain-containing protein [Aliikangiella coralliicola]